MADQRRDPEQRPSPDALLEAARRAGPQVGKLKIFVGAAPGVGKTYEMLQAARAKLAEGVDVVVGVVETHGRKETEALLEGLQVLPRKPTIYVNRILSEFDIDAALKRRPSSSWSTSWRTPTFPAAATPSATRTSRSCWRTASTSTPPSIFSTSRA